VIDCSPAGDAPDDFDAPLFNKSWIYFFQGVLVFAYDNRRIVLPEQEIAFSGIHIHKAILFQSNIKIGVCAAVYNIPQVLSFDPRHLRICVTLKPEDACLFNL
jgi:hypothetical protein